MSELIYLVGLPGSGKSYFAEKMLEKHPDYIYLSSDKIRGELYGDETCQDNPSQVFDLMLRRTIQALKSGNTVIYDATNVVRRNRINILKSISRLKGVDIIKRCYVLWERIDTCIERDSKRDRKVGADVIWKMVKRFQVPFMDEGWDVVNIHRNENTIFYNLEDFDLNIPHENPHHPNTIKEHVDNVLKVIRETYKDAPQDDFRKYIQEQIALWHDVGKIYTKTFYNKKGEKSDIAHYYDHQNVSAYLELGNKELIGSEENELTCYMLSYFVNMHMEPFFDESNYYKNMRPILREVVEEFHQYDLKGA